MKKKEFLIVASIISAIGLSAWAIPRVEQWRREAPVQAQLDEMELTLNQMVLLLPIASVESYNTEWRPLEQRANELQLKLMVVHTGHVP